MPKKSKTPSNVVKTIDRYYPFTMTSLFESKKGGYSTVKQELHLTIMSVFRQKENRSTLTFLGNTGRREFIGRQNADGGLSIGCMDFSRNATRKIARWAGLSTMFIRQYLS